MGIRAIQAGNVDVLAIQKELRGAILQNTERVQVVRGDMNDMQLALTVHKEQLSKIEARVELCDEQFTGFRKGFREVRVTGTEDALLPTTPATMTPSLPSRPQSSRTPRSITPLLPSMRGSSIGNAPLTSWA